MHANCSGFFLKSFAITMLPILSSATITVYRFDFNTPFCSSERVKKSISPKDRRFVNCQRADATLPDIALATLIFKTLKSNFTNVQI